MDDYLLSGPMKAIDVINEITGSERSTCSDCAWAAR